MLGIAVTISACAAPANLPAEAVACSEQSADQAQGFPPQPEDIPFPTRQWPEGDLPPVVDGAALDEAAEEAFANEADLRVRAVVIVHGGKIVYEAYSPNTGIMPGQGDGPNTLLPGHSLAKSFTSALVGILVRECQLDVYAPANVPEWSSDERSTISIDDMLRMSSGLSWTEGLYPDNEDQSNMLEAEDSAAYAADKALLYEPGTHFLYNTGNFHIVSRILADHVGTGTEFREFMNAELLEKLGITRFEIEFDHAGTWLGGVSAVTTARNFAKFGLLYLRDGVWDGERILPEGWVDYSRTPSESNPEYGAGWWLEPDRPGTFFALGRWGQVIAVVPEHDLTFVILSTDSNLSLELSEVIMNAFAVLE